MDVKTLLTHHRIKQREIASELAVTPGAVSQVVNGKGQSRRIQEHIAKRLNKPYSKVWGKAA